MGRRLAFLLAATFSVVAAQAGASSSLSNRSLPAQIWGWELDAAGVRTAHATSLVELRRRGINTIVLDGARVPSAQVARIRRLGVRCPAGSRRRAEPDLDRGGNPEMPVTVVRLTRLTIGPAS